MNESKSDQSTPVCPRCGADLDPGVAQGLCPRCALEAAGEDTEQATSRTDTFFEPPPLERLAKAFPQFEILELIGRGGMGAVYRARQPHLDRIVALKILPQSLAESPEFRERFSREARLLARLNHPAIVTVHDFGEADGFFFLLMEYVDGVNLRQAMRAGGFTPEQALEVTPAICEALQFAHEEGVLHRDIKPENILIDSRGRVKIADFGIAKLIGSPEAASGPLTGSMVPGTPQYMAPEQIEHPSDVDHRADIYSLGVVFYEMLTGELPLGRFPAPSEKTAVDSQVDEIVFRALEKERDRRQQSAGQVRTEVEAATIARGRHPGYGIPSPAGETAPPPLREKTFRGPAVWAIVLVVAGFLIAGASFRLVRSSELAKSAQVKARVARVEADAARQLERAEERVEVWRKELRQLPSGNSRYANLRDRILQSEENQLRFRRELVDWRREATSGSTGEPGPELLLIAVGLLLALAGCIKGWRTLLHQRRSGDRTPGVTVLAGISALLLPLLLIDLAILRLVPELGPAILTLLVIDAVLIGFFVRWLRSPAGVKPETISPPPSPPVNPWPRRIFWLILILFVFLPMISLLFPLLAYQRLRVIPPPTLQGVQSAAVPSQIRAGMFAPVVNANPGDNDPRQFDVILTLTPGYLATVQLRVSDEDGESSALDSLDGWLTHPSSGEKPAGHRLRWEILDDAIRLQQDIDHDARICGSASLESFPGFTWTAIRGDRSYWFSESEWAIGVPHDLPLFSGSTSNGPGECRIIARITVYPLNSGAEPSPKNTFRCTDDWRKLVVRQN